MLSLDTAVFSLASLTVFANVLIVALAGLLAYETVTKRQTPVTGFGQRHGLLLMFLVALTAMGGSLYLSEIALWTPCKLCWFQRIFLYPQVPLLALALWKRDRGIASYIFFLCLIGIAISAYHYGLHVHAHLVPVPEEEGVNALFQPCDDTGVSCAKTEIPFFFSYITIPFMALSASVLNLMGSWVMMRRKV